jgi:hypothetical protein
MQEYMMILQKYQFELRDCSHIFLCHKEEGISLEKNYKSFKFTVAMGSWLHLSPIANLGHWQWGLVTIAAGTGCITKQRSSINVATSERLHPIIATATKPTCQRSNVATESSKFSPTLLSEMKTDDVKNSYYPEITRVHIGRNDYTNSIKINWSWYNLILYCQPLSIIWRGEKFLKNCHGKFTFDNS